MFTINKVPGFATQMHRDVVSRVTGFSPISTKISDGNSYDKDNDVNPREDFSKVSRARSEDIPLEDMSMRKASLAQNCSICSERKESFKLGSLSSSDIASVSTKHSEETSFTSSQNDELKARKRGQVETV